MSDHVAHPVQNIPIALSICIPIRNRAAYIEETINTLRAQLRSDVEIVIVDGASNDGTDIALARLSSSIPNFRFNRLDTNGGVDADLKLAVNLARGRYCWLMSSDDHAAANTIDRIFDSLTTWSPGVLLFDRFEATREMKIFGTKRWIPDTNQTTRWNFGKSSEVDLYLKKINSIGALFSYIPCIVVERKSWLEAHSHLLNGTCYAHVYACLSLLLKGSSLVYVPEPLVICRNDNDSFSSQGKIARFNIDFEGYRRVAQQIIMDHRNVDIMQVLRREHGFGRLMYIRSQMEYKDWLTYSSTKLNSIGYNPRFVYIAGIVGSVGGLVAIARKILAIFKRVSHIMKSRMQ